MKKINKKKLIKIKGGIINNSTLISSEIYPTTIEGTGTDINDKILCSCSSTGDNTNNAILCNCKDKSCNPT